MKQRGTMVIVNQHCLTRGDNSYSWKSQPMMFNGRYPAGNVLLSFSVLMAGASISKILLVFKHMGLSAYNARTFFFPQKNFLFPAVLNNWECYPAALTEKIENMKDAVWSGDGPFDSMGHSAKFGFYTMFCNTVLKVVHFELLQVSGVVRNGQLYFLKGVEGLGNFFWARFFSTSGCTGIVFQFVPYPSFALLALHNFSGYFLYTIFFFLLIAQPPIKKIMVHP